MYTQEDKDCQVEISNIPNDSHRACVPSDLLPRHIELIPMFSSG